MRPQSTRTRRLRGQVEFVATEEPIAIEPAFGFAILCLGSKTSFAQCKTRNAAFGNMRLRYRAPLHPSRRF
jgi:hypothetical protein